LRFYVFRAVLLKMQVFWDGAQYRLVAKSQVHFENSQRLNLRKDQANLQDCLILKKVRSLETSVTSYHSKRCNIPEKLNLQPSGSWEANRR